MAMAALLPPTDAGDGSCVALTIADTSCEKLRPFCVPASHVKDVPTHVEDADEYISRYCP